MITKFSLFEQIKINVDDLEDLKLVLRIPQVGSKIFDYEIQNDKIVITNHEFEPYILYDFVVLLDGTFIIGKMHYRISGSKIIKAAGEIKIDENGKIIYLNNQSGHYKPSKENLLDISNKLKELNLLDQNVKIDELY
jgi:hypothetical protein